MAFDFFRKYQKVILYTAGIFALLTFSITGAVWGFFTPEAHEGYVGAKMTLPDGRVIEVDYEDAIVGRLLARAAGNPAVVLPPLAEQEGESVVDRYAALRRLAIEFGIEVSDTEVDRAIEQARSVLDRVFGGYESTTDLALGLGYSSLQAYREVVKEALRVGTFLRLQALGADLTDAAIAEQVLGDEEVIRLRVAKLDKEQIEAELREEEVTDEELLAWIEELPPEEKRPYQDTNHVALGAVGIVYEEFDPAQWQERLEGREWTDEELRREYEFRRETFFRRSPQTGSNGSPIGNEGEKREESGEGRGAGEGRGGDGNVGQEPGGAPEETPPPGEAQEPSPQGGPAEGGPQEGEVGEAGAAAAGERPAAPRPQGPQPQGREQQGPPQPPSPYVPFPRAKDRLLGMLQAEAALDAVRNGPLQELFVEHMSVAIAARNEALRALSEARGALEEAEAEQPADDEAVAAAEAGVEAAEAALEEARGALDERRKGFDFVTRMTELIGERAGVATHRIEEPQGADGLEDLGPLGTWDATFAATSMGAPGDISTNLQRTDRAAFHFQVTEVEETPLRPLDEIAERARADYYTKKADARAEEIAESFETTLVELARARMEDRVAEIEQEIDEQVREDFESWKTELETQRDRALEQIGRLPEGTRVRQQWRDRLEEIEADLADADRQREEIRARLEEEKEQRIEEEARKQFGAVLAEAAEGTPFEIETVGPYLESLNRKPRFRQRFPETVVFLFGDPGRMEYIRGLEPGEATELLDDVGNRAFCVAVLDERRPAELRDLTRAQILSARQQLEAERLRKLIDQSFSIEALEKRWGYESARPRERETEPPAHGEDTGEREGG